ncbi:DNA phosphorothioation-dependent restriction protein DptF [Romboutsia sp. Marseille-P6047]|uniref:DNA phosphorothioation-dependent restriction protein DptF n=1 Tax=Romboutsia sp. Marseille-P6047 TaxID=2161817 RepID=UPI000F05ABD6|nr:DNA phosphorothioation-dependent restriction protein DptF [Romboutsia sp. Marseille-P6047]
MNINIYKFLEKDYIELYSIGTDIDNSVFTSPHSVIVKSRVFVEQLIDNISSLERLQGLNELNLSQRINTLKYKGIIDNEISDYLHEIRMLGNQAAHENIEEELVLALKAHKNIYKVTSWFIEVYIDYNFKTPIYKSPKPMNNSQSESSNMFMKIMGKMEDLLKLNKSNEEKIAQVSAKKVEETVDIKEYKEEISVTKEVEEIRKSECLIEDLSRLKESSREAVEGVNVFTDFKKYMHVDRNAQMELEEIIVESNKQTKSQLILVCGSVGDGKSHIISYFKNKYPDIIKNFTLHNDATESLEPNKTSMDTLDDLLENFTDEKIASSSQKLILAINLGTLNNFIDSEYGERFTKLKTFVNEKKILERSIADNSFDKDSNIQFVNFSDYSLYTLKDEKVESEYIKSLIKKITDKSEINIFYNSYKTNCMKCKNKDKCPIKSNYELLSEDKTQDAIVDLLVQCIIKNKIIISTRALLNFMYDLLIARTYIDIHSPMFKDDISKLKNEEYINSLTPNIIFDHEELSFIFKALNTLDPLNVRNREVDDFIIKFNNSVKVMDFFDEYIDYPKGYISKLHNINDEEKLDKKTKKELLKLFIRSYYLCGKGNIFNLRDTVYEDFIRYVYYWNKGDKAKLKGLYTEVKNGIIRWNGEADKNQINIFIGKNQVKYKVSEELELKADTTNLPSSKESRLEKFLTTIEIKYKGDRLDESCGIDIDFPLYELLIRVGNGYRPNKKDKNHFIKFIEFMNKIEMAGSQKTQLIFTEKNREENKKFRLEYDDEFEIYKFMEI